MMPAEPDVTPDRAAATHDRVARPHGAQPQQRGTREPSSPAPTPAATVEALEALWALAALAALAIYDNARWQIKKHQYAAAVLLAQAAVEMGVWGAFTSLLVRRDGEIDDKTFRERVPDLSFMDVGTRRLWTELTGHRVTRPRDPPVWKQYVEHVEYRNLIAHGQTWGDSGGYASVVAAGQFILRLDDQMRQVDEADPDF
jgi:hypothetical protein